MRAVLVIVFAVGCAQGGAPNLENGDAQQQQHVDARPGIDGSFTHDAIPPLDGPVDAPVTPLDAAIDAPPPDASSPLFCTDNTDCTDPGTCCFVSFCVAGQGIGAQLCFPS